LFVPFQIRSVGSAVFAVCSVAVTAKVVAASR
jgi:hypothetical protein